MTESMTGAGFQRIVSLELRHLTTMMAFMSEKPSNGCTKHNSKDIIYATPSWEKYICNFVLLLQSNMSFSQQSLTIIIYIYCLFVCLFAVVVLFVFCFVFQKNITLTIKKYKLKCILITNNKINLHVFYVSLIWPLGQPFCSDERLKTQNGR